MEETKLSSRQREVLDQFRSNLEDLLSPYHNDTVLLKWLRARNFDLKKAEKHFRQIDLHEKMYAPNTVETYVKPKVVQGYEGTFFLGFAKDGAPVRYVPCTVDSYGFVLSVSSFDMQEYFVNIAEADLKKMMEHNMKAGYDHRDIIYILDMDNFSFKDFTYKCVIESVLEVFRIIQEYRPEIWRYVLVVNAPSFFDRLAFLFKPVLRKTFLDKIKFASKDTTKELLLTYIDEDVLPVFLGGRRVDSKGDPYFKELISPYGKRIPEEYYLSNFMHLIDERDSGVKVATIRARECFNVPLVVREAGSSIRIEIRTKNGSIQFAVLFREFGEDTENPDLPESDEYIDPNDENSNVLLVGFKFKCQCHIAPCDGTWTAIRPGIHILLFDNTNSWFGSRKLYYRVTLTPPDS